jgi:hypothetical protein
VPDIIPSASTSPDWIMSNSTATRMYSDTVQSPLFDLTNRSMAAFSLAVTLNRIVSPLRSFFFSVGLLAVVSSSR